MTRSNSSVNIFRGLFLPLFIVITLAFSLFPWFYGVVKTPPDRIFGGVNRFSADYYIYVSFVETGIRGHLREYHLTTTKPQEPIWIHGIYTVSGYLGRLGNLGSLGVDAIAIYHLDRIVLGGVFIGVLYLLYMSVFRSVFWTALCLFFVFYVPGFPKTLDVLGRWDARYLSWVQELNIVGRATSPPHYLLGFSLFVLTIWYFMESRAGIVKKSAVLILLTPVGTIANPVNVLVLLATLGAYSFISVASRGIRGVKGIKGEELRLMVTAGLTILGSLPVAFYYQQKLSIFPWGPRSNALKFYIPGIPIDGRDLVLALGPVGVLAVVGIAIFFIGLIRPIRHIGPIGESRWFLLFFSWIVVQFGFLAISQAWGVDPLRFLQGLYYIPLAGFAAVGMREIGGIRGIGERRGKMIAVGIVGVAFLISLPTLILSYRDHLFMNTDYSVFTSIIYPTTYQYEAYKFMEKNTPFASGVMAFYEVTEVLPAFSGNTTERDLGHGDKLPFFSNKLTPSEALAFLKKHRMSYVWNGYQARSAGFNPSLYPFLKKIFENKEVSIYQII